MGISSQKLSANMQALSYAMGLVPQASAADESQRPNLATRRASDEGIALPEAMSLEYVPGKPFKNFGRALAWGAELPLPYNMRQADEAAQQAQQTFANENAAATMLFDTLDKQLADNSAHASVTQAARFYDNGREQAANARAAFFAPAASAEQREAAFAQATQLQAGALAFLGQEANDQQRVLGQFYAQEISTSRAGLQSVDMNHDDGIFSTEAAIAQIENLPIGSAEEEIVMRTQLGNAAVRAQSTMSALLKGAGSIAGSVPNPYAQAAGVAAQAIGAVLGNERVKLQRGTVIKMLIEQQDALTAMTKAFRPQLVELHENLIAEGRPLGLDVPSWSATPVNIPTPYTDAYRSLYFPQGEGLGPNPPPPETPLRRVQPAPSGGTEPRGFVGPPPPGVLRYGRAGYAPSTSRAPRAPVREGSTPAPAPSVDEIEQRTRDSFREFYERPMDRP